MSILAKFTKHPRVLVVGAAGFIGKHVTQVGWDKSDIKWGSSFEDLYVEGINNTHYDFIIWLAMTDSVKYDVQSQAILGWYMADHPKTHVIFASSAAVYGNTLHPAHENDVLWPVNEYGLGKIHGEDLVKRAKRHTILRFSNVFGKGGNGIIDKILGGNNKIYGDGEQTRDFIHVSIIQMVINEIIKRPRRWRGTYNVSTGRDRSINTVYKMYGNGKPKYLKAKDEINVSCLDNSRLLTNLYRLRKVHRD